MRIRLLLALTILLLCAETAWPSEVELYQRKKFRKISLTYGLVVTNKGEYPLRDIHVYIPKITDFPPFQTVTIRTISPPVCNVEISPAATALLKFVIREIKPGEKRKFLVTADVTICEVTYRVSEEKAENLPGWAGRYLALEGHFNASSYQLKKKCQELGKEENPLQRARKIYEYLISGAFVFSDSPKGLGVDGAYEKKRLNCSDAALLYLVMCRLCGIPSRYVGGIFYSSSKKWYPLLHGWVEIYIPPFGWLPVDPTLGRLSEKHRDECFAHIRNRYIALWSNQFSSFYVEASSGRDLDNLSVGNSIYAVSK